MKMSFWWSIDLGDFLFPGFTVRSTWSLVATCFAVASLSFLFEWLRYLQAVQRQKELLLRSKQLRMICPSDRTTLLDGARVENPTNPLNITLLDRFLLFGAELSLWFVLQNLGYLIMLAVMLYNGWLFVSAILGGGLGYLVFGQLFMKINLQNCQIIRDAFCMQHCGLPENIASERDGESTPALVAAGSSQEPLSCHSQVTVSVHAENDS